MRLPAFCLPPLLFSPYRRRLLLLFLAIFFAPSGPRLRWPLLFPAASCAQAEAPEPRGRTQPTVRVGSRQARECSGGALAPSLLLSHSHLYQTRVHRPGTHVLLKPMGAPGPLLERGWLLPYAHVQGCREPVPVALHDAWRQRLPHPPRPRRRGLLCQLGAAQRWEDGPPAGLLAAQGEAGLWAQPSGRGHHDRLLVTVDRAQLSTTGSGTHTRGPTRTCPLLPLLVQRLNPGFQGA